VKLLLEQGCDLLAEDGFHVTSFHAAASKGNVDVLEVQLATIIIIMSSSCSSILSTIIIISFFIECVCYQHHHHRHYFLVQILLAHHAEQRAEYQRMLHAHSRFRKRGSISIMFKKMVRACTGPCNRTLHEDLFFDLFDFFDFFDLFGLFDLPVTLLCALCFASRERWPVL
jgi:hypothetical protein